MYRITWKSFSPLSGEIKSVDDPVSSSQMDFESFVEIYGALLETLDGRDMSSYVDFYFEKSACNSSLLVFVDENARLDFRDEAILMGLIPPMRDIMEGEDAEEKRLRKEEEMRRTKAIEKQRMLKALRSAASKTEIEKKKKQKMLMDAQKSLDLLGEKLKNKDLPPGEKIKIQSKIDKIIRILSDPKHASV
jgi:hypothetical protein